MTCLAINRGISLFHKSPASLDISGGESQVYETNPWKWTETGSQAIQDIEPELRRARFLEDLAEAAREAKSDGWAGPNSKHVDVAALDMALRFIELLPPEIPAPEPSVSPTGEIILGWERGPFRMFSIALKGDDKLAFAAFNRGQRISGAFEFHMDALPGEVVHQLVSWLSS